MTSREALNGPTRTRDDCKPTAAPRKTPHHPQELLPPAYHRPTDDRKQDAFAWEQARAAACQHCSSCLEAGAAGPE
jgi:hypothetical protein